MIELKDLAIAFEVMYPEYGKGLRSELGQQWWSISHDKVPVGVKNQLWLWSIFKAGASAGMTLRRD